MKALVKTILSYWLFFLLLIPSLQAAEMPAEKIQVLLIITAKEGQFQQKANEYTLTLSDVNHQALWFTDRPNRQAGYSQTSNLINNWAKYFGQDNPNAGLLYDALTDKSQSQSNHPIAIELSSPTHTKKHLIFKVKLLDKRLPAEKLENVSLFIDDLSGTFYGNGILVGDHIGTPRSR